MPEHELLLDVGTEQIFRLGATGPVIVGRTATIEIRRYAQLQMATPPKGWSTETSLAPLEPGVTYTAYGWTETNEWSTASVSFTVADLSDLAPSEVLYEAYDEPSDDVVGRRVDLADFRKLSCADLQN